MRQVQIMKHVPTHSKICNKNSPFNIMNDMKLQLNLKQPDYKKQQRIF